MATFKGVRPIGEVVGVISDMATVLVKATGIFTNYSKDDDTADYYEEIIVPAKIVTRGTGTVKDFFCYSIGESVYIVYLDGQFEEESYTYEAEAQALGFGSKYKGYICACVGAVYSNYSNLPAYYGEVRVIDFGCGTITVDLEDKTLDVKFDGEITINGKEIYLNS